jgi:hypothetical protein
MSNKPLAKALAKVIIAAAWADITWHLMRSTASNICWRNWARGLAAAIWS